MALLTMVTASATFYASYLHYSRQDADGCVFKSLVANNSG